MAEGKYDDLLRLQKLKENGTLTELEFEKEKSRLLSSSIEVNSNLQYSKNKVSTNYTSAKPLNGGAKFGIILKYTAMGFILGLMLPMGRFTFSKCYWYWHWCCHICNIGIDY